MSESYNRNLARLNFTHHLADLTNNITYLNDIHHRFKMDKKNAEFYKQQIECAIKENLALHEKLKTDLVEVF